LKNVRFIQTEVEVLGHKVSAKGLSNLDSNIESIKKWKPPSNLNELRSFLGAIGYYRDFIDKYARKTAPFCKLLRKDVEFQWNKEQNDSFKIFKEFKIFLFFLFFFYFINFFFYFIINQ